jgi:hypothetical protein
LALYLPKLAVIASISFGFLFLGLPFCLGCCGKTWRSCWLKYGTGVSFMLDSFGLLGAFEGEPNCVGYWHENDNDVWSMVVSKCNLWLQ